MTTTHENERNLLGCILIRPGTFADVAGELTRSDFALQAHGEVFEAIRHLDGGSTPIDALTVANALTAQSTIWTGPGTPNQYLIELMAGVVTIDNVGWHARQIKQAAQRRRWHRIGAQIAADAVNTSIDYEEFLDRTERATYAESIHQAGGTADIKTVARTVLHTIEERRDNKGPVTGVAVGIKAFDAATCGLQPGQLVILAARPGMGKTALALNMALGAAATATNVLMFSLEMAKEELFERMIAADGSISSDDLKRPSGISFFTKLSSSITRLADYPICFSDETALTVQAIRSSARRWRAKYPGAGLIIVDYLQLMSSEKGSDRSREQEISAISRGLKLLARELNCPVIALSQLNRACEARADKRPMLSDLRESGAIEQDADIVGFIYRHEVYYPDEKPGEAELIIAKHRNGGGGLIPLKWRADMQRFTDR